MCRYVKKILIYVWCRVYIVQIQKIDCFGRVAIKDVTVRYIIVNLEARWPTWRALSERPLNMIKHVCPQKNRHIKEAPCSYDKYIRSVIIHKWIISIKFSIPRICGTLGFVGNKFVGKTCENTQRTEDPFSLSSRG